MQARAGNLAVQRLVVQAQAVKTRPKTTSRHPKAKAATRPKPPPAPSFRLFGVKFKVVAGAVAGKAGWTFTPQAGGFAAERIMPHAAWRPASGSASDVIERTTIQVSGGTATAAPVEAIPRGTTLTIPLDNHERPTLKALTVGAVQAEALDIPTPGLNIGDALTLSVAGRRKVYVFSNLVPDTGPPVSGFFFLGAESHLQGGTGVEGADVSPFATTFPALVAANKISTAEAADQPIMAFLSEIEGGFGTVQTADTGVLSFGFAQWTAASDLPPMLARIPQPVFQRYLGKYGLGVGTPVLGTPTSVHKFAPASQNVPKLAARNPGEHCLTLNGVELVSQRLHDAASNWLANLPTLALAAQSAKARFLAATTKAQQKAAAKKILALWGKLKGLPGVKGAPPAALVANPDQMADHLTAAATAAQGQANAVVIGTQSVEAVRTNEWALRFQVAGRDPDVQAAEVHEAHDSFVKVLAETTSGIPNSRLMQSDRSHAALFSTFINAGGKAFTAMKQAVKEFHDDQVAGADAKTKKDWEKFPWQTASDPRWSTMFDPVRDDFEDVAEAKLLTHTWDPPRRKKLLDKHFP